MDIDSLSALSRAEQIRTLYRAGYGTRDIACKVYGTLEPTEANMAYVRVAARQRTEKGDVSVHDLSYRQSKHYCEWRREYHRRRYASLPWVRDYYKRKRAARWKGLRDSVRNQKAPAPEGAEAF